MLTAPTKAFVTMLITTISGVAAAIVLQVPDSGTVKLWGGIIVAVCAVLLNTFGVYFATNKAPVTPAAPAAAPMTVGWRQPTTYATGGRVSGPPIRNEFVVTGRAVQPSSADLDAEAAAFKGADPAPFEQSN